MNSIVLAYKEGYIGVGVLTMAFTRTAIPQRSISAGELGR